MPARRLCLSVLLLTFSVFAQSPTASLVGIVQDPSGAGVPGARVTAHNLATNEDRQRPTSNDGSFILSNLAPGKYSVFVEHTGFRRLEQRGIELNVDQSARLILTLQLGAVSETVEVTASAPLINTENGTQGEVISGLELTQMPLDGREFSDLAYQVPGVERTAQSGQGSGFAINGARSDNTNFVVDGFNDQGPHNGDIQARPPIDSLQEFRAQTSGYSAEFGRLAGGVITMVVKSGTNQLHGSMFEFLRNDALDAKGFFVSDKPELRRNQFGATLGGPVFLPRLYNGRNRTFFLMSWESQRQINGLSKLAVVPTALEHAGDYSTSTTLLHDPLAAGNCTATDRSACFPANKIPLSRWNAGARQIIDYYPLPNHPGVNNYISTISQPGIWSSYAGRLDQRLGERDNLSFRAIVRDNDGSNVYKASSIPGFGSTFNQNDALLGLSYTHIFTPSVINEFRAGLTRSTRDEKGQNQGHDFAADFGIPGLTTEPSKIGFPSFSITNYAAIGDFSRQPVLFAATNFQLGNTATWILGRHAVKLGIDVLRAEHYEDIYGSQRGTFAFAGKWTNIALADFQLGLLNTDSRVLSASPNYLIGTAIGSFIQDDYKITSRLTLNIGLRWEIQPPVYDKDGRLSNYIPSLGKLVVADASYIPNFNQLIASSALAGDVVLAKSVGLPQALAYTRYTDFAPRMGLAWRPFGGNRTVFRAGYGLFYGNTQFEPLRIDLSALYPFSITESYTRTNSPLGLTLTNPFPAGSAAIGGVTNVIAYDTHPPAQYVLSYNATVEREIGHGASVEIAYIGSRGRHLSRRYDYNQAYPLPSAKVNGALPKPVSNLGSIYYYSLGANSDYNSAVVTLRKRFNNGIFFRVNYVFGKSTDDISQVSSSPAGGFQGAQDARNLRGEHARSDFDTQHSFTANFSYELPLGHNRWLRGFEISGTGRAYSGQPFTPQVSGASLANGEATRPDRLANGSVPNPSPTGWFDVSAFKLVPTGAYRFGNSGRNILNGPGFIGMNAGLSKRFTFGEKQSLQFRWEVFDVTNHTNFLLPVDTVNTTNAATITSANAARVMQFGARVQF